MVHGLALVEHRAGLGTEHAGNRLEQRRFAGAVGADDRERLTLFDLERDGEERLEVLVEDIDILYFEDAHIGVPPI